MKINELKIGVTYRGSDGNLYRKHYASEMMKLREGVEDFIMFSSTALHSDYQLWDYENRLDEDLKDIDFEEVSQAEKTTMTENEALEKLNFMANGTTLLPEMQEACKVGIKAIKRIQAIRNIVC